VALEHKIMAFLLINLTGSKENAPHKAEHYLSLVARGGIEPPTQGFSIRSARPISLLNHLVLPPCEKFVHKINMPFVWD